MGVTLLPGHHCPQSLIVCSIHTAKSSRTRGSLGMRFGNEVTKAELWEENRLFSPS